MRDKILKKIVEARRLNDAYISQNPQEERYQDVKLELERIEADVRDHWPLTDAEKKEVCIGLYAVRELEGVEDDLARKLEILDYELTLDQDTIIEQIEKAQRYNDEYISESPRDKRFQTVKLGLERLTAIVRDHWPLTDAEKKKVNFGLYDVGKLEELPTDLANVLEDLDYDLKYDWQE